MVGNSCRNSTQLDAFHTALTSFGLKDDGFQGPKLTWCNGR